VAVAVAAIAATKLPPIATPMATKTLVATMMVGALTITNNQLKEVVATAAETATMTARMANEN
jgi:hypothetical protein